LKDVIVDEIGIGWEKWKEDKGRTENGYRTVCHVATQVDRDRLQERENISNRVGY